jgi:hypothetical protein
MHPHFVTPAKAGVQCFFNVWIPAFAGMTVWLMELLSRDTESS